MEKLNENYIRRERQRKKERQEVISQMRASLKACTMDEVRQHKLPFNQALLIGLQEKGYTLTVTYIKQLIDFQTEMTEKAGPGNVLGSKPQLKDSKNILKTVSDNLVKAEEYHNEENYAKECETFLKLATHMAYLHPDWWWLGEQLLLQSISIAKQYPCQGGKYEALSRYAYAKFLTDNIRDMKAPQEHLMIVRELSNGMKWTTYIIFPEEKDILFSRANYMLYVCLIRETRACMKSDPEKAIRLANLARKRASEACYLDGETRALLLKGICELCIHSNAAAIATFTKAFYVQQRLGNLEGICETRLQLAQAYLMNGDTLLSLKTLMMSRDCAEQNSMYFYLAQAYKYLGEFYLNNGEPKKATPLLGEALKIFHKIEDIKESEQVRNLEAISSGLELFPQYMKLLANANHPKTGMESLMKIIDWKDSRKQFWTQADVSADVSRTPSQDIVRDEHDTIEEIDSEPFITENNSDLDQENNDDVVELHLNLNAFRADSDTELQESVSQIESDIGNAGVEATAENRVPLSPTPSFDQKECERQAGLKDESRDVSSISTKDEAEEVFE